MFDKQQADAYRSISAPEGLWEQVEASAKREQASRSCRIAVKFCGAAAACVLLVAAVPLLHRENTAELSVNGQSLTGEGIVLSETADASAFAVARAATLYTVPISMEVQKETVISLSDGTMEVFDAETQALLFAGTEYTAESPILVQWSVDAADLSVIHGMTVGEMQEISLAYDSNKGGWVIRQEEKE